MDSPGYHYVNFMDFGTIHGMNVITYYHFSCKKIDQSFTPSSGRNSHSSCSSPSSLPDCHHHLSLVLSLVVISMAERHGRLCDQWNCSVQCPVPFAPSMAAFFCHHDCGPSILSLSMFLLLFGYGFVEISIKNISTSPKQKKKLQQNSLASSQLW